MYGYERKYLKRLEFVVRVEHSRYVTKGWLIKYHIQWFLIKNHRHRLMGLKNQPSANMRSINRVCSQWSMLIAVSMWLSMCMIWMVHGPNSSATCLPYFIIIHYHFFSSQSCVAVLYQGPHSCSLILALRTHNLGAYFWPIFAWPWWCIATFFNRWISPLDTFGVVVMTW